MREPLAPLDWAPVSVHPPFIDYPGGQYRSGDPDERRAALHGMELGAYDQHFLHWPAGWDVPTVATVVWQFRHAGTRRAHRVGGEPR